jgi:hypothetical protein
MLNAGVALAQIAAVVILVQVLVEGSRVIEASFLAKITGRVPVEAARGVTLIPVAGKRSLPIEGLLPQKSLLVGHAHVAQVPVVRLLKMVAQCGQGPAEEAAGVDAADGEVEGLEDGVEKGAGHDDAAGVVRDSAWAAVHAPDWESHEGLEVAGALEDEDQVLVRLAHGAFLEGRGGEWGREGGRRGKEREMDRTRLLSSLDLSRSMQEGAGG